MKIVAQARAFQRVYGFFLGSKPQSRKKHDLCATIFLARHYRLHPR
jgi:hypothetical protein